MSTIVSGNILSDIAYKQARNFIFKINDADMVYASISSNDFESETIFTKGKEIYFAKCLFIRNNNQCVSNCNWSGYGYLTTDLKKTCSSCQSISKVEYMGICLDICPPGMVAVSGGICEPLCTSPNIYYDIAKQKCMAICENTGSPNHLNQCEDFTKGLVSEEDGNIVNSCSTNAVKINLKCVNCAKLSLLKCSSSNSCCASCPSNFGTIDNGRECLHCMSNRRIYFKGECLQNCPYGTEFSFSRCILCKETQKQFYLDVNDNKKSSCVQTCPLNTSVDESNKVCKDCSAFNMYLENGQCVSKCKYCSDMNNVCILCNKCQSLAQLLDRNSGKCVSTCPTGSLSLPNDECANCSDGDYKVYFDGKCLETCPSLYEIDKSGICQCSKYIYSGSCLQTCPNGTVAAGNKCILCKGYLMDNKCVIKCPIGTFTDQLNKLCVKDIDETVVCYNDCYQRGMCDLDSKRCICNLGFSGDFCQIQKFSNNTLSNEILNEFFIIPGNKIHSSKVNFFKYYLSPQYRKSFSGYKLEWQVYIPNSSIHNQYTNNTILLDDKKKYLNGRKEEILKLDAFSFKEGKNIVRLSISDTESDKNYYTSIIITVDSLPLSRFSLDIKYLEAGVEKEYATEFSTLLLIQVKDTVSNSNKLKYKYFYMNENSDKIAMSPFYSNTSYFVDTFPVCNEILVLIENEVGESLEIYKKVDVREKKYSPFNKTIEINESINKSLSEDNFKINMNKKLIMTNHYLNILDGPLADGLITRITSQILEGFHYSIKSSNSTISHLSLIAVFNSLTKNLNNNNINSKIYSHLSHLNSMMYNFSQIINQLEDTTRFDEKEISIYYKSIESLYKTLTNIPKEVSYLKNSISNFNEYCSLSMTQGEDLEKSYKNYQVYLSKPGRDRDSFSLSSLNTTNRSILNISSENQKESDFFSINKQNFKDIQSHLNSSKTFLSDIAFIVSTYPNNHLTNKSLGTNVQLSAKSVKTSFYNTKTRNTSEVTKQFQYEVNLQLLTANTSMLFNSSCISMDDIGSANPETCHTFYNYKQNRTICKCRGGSEVLNIFNYTLTNLSKLFQFPKFSFNLFNPLSMCIIFGSVSVIVLISIFLLFYDLYQDKKSLSDNQINNYKFMKQEFEDLISLGKTNIFTFSLFVTMFMYPFMAIFSVYKFSLPRFLTFSFEILQIFMTLIVTLIPYYKVPFTYGQIFMDERDLEMSEVPITNLPAKLVDIFSTLIFCYLCSSLISLILRISYRLTTNENVLEKLWNRKKIILNRYIRDYYSSPFRLERKWLMLKTNIMAYTFICSKWIEKKVKKLKRSRSQLNEERDLYMNTGRVYKKTQNTASKSGHFIELVEQNNRSFKKSKENIILNFTTYNEKSSIEDGKSYRTNIFYFCKENNFCLNVKESSGNSLLIDLDLKRKSHKRSRVRMFKFAKEQQRLNRLSLKQFQNLQMRRLISFSHSNIIPNKIFLSYEQNNNSAFKIILSFCLLVILYSSFYILMIFMIADIYSRYYYYIIKVWLLPVLIEAFVYTFLNSYFFNLFKSFLLFKFYRFRKRAGWKSYLFNFLVDSNILAIFKIRKMMFKYSIELDYAFNETAR